MSIRKRVKAIFVKPERELVLVKPKLQELRCTLQYASNSEYPLVAIVEFFDAVSRWHDRGISDLIAAFEGVNYGQYGELLEKLRILQRHFVDAGRQKHGWNRTKYGERVTADNVFLGDNRVSSWKQRKDMPRGDWGFPGMEEKSDYDVVSEQAREFMTSHAGPMITIIRDLEAVVI